MEGGVYISFNSSISASSSIVGSSSSSIRSTSYWDEV